MDADAPLTVGVNRAAWCGVGSGVLVVKPDGATTMQKLSALDDQFTLRDPTAPSDVEALRNLFDTNGSGRLDAGNAQLEEQAAAVGVCFPFGRPPPALNPARLLHATFH